MNNFKPDCLIISPEASDPQSVTLFEELTSKGMNPYILPLKDQGKEVLHRVVLNDNEVFYGEDLSEVKAVYLRCISTDVPPVVPPLMNEMEFRMWQARYLKEELKQKVFSGLINILERRGALIVNPPRTYFHHNAKAQFFYMLHKEGIPVPYTFSTNSLEFFCRHHSPENSFIIKAGYGVGGTRRLAGDLAADELKYCPALFQEEVKGKTIRVHTAGDNVVLALRILSEDIDSRTDPGGFEEVRLSHEHEMLIARANRILGLHFSAWDVIVSSEGRLYLLDCNPGPYIWWIGPYYSRIVMSALSRLMACYIDKGNTGGLPHEGRSFTSEARSLNKQDERLGDILRGISDSWKTLLRLRN